MSLRSSLRGLLFSQIAYLIRIGRVRAIDATDAPQIPADFHPSNVPPQLLEVPLNVLRTFLLGTFFGTGKSARRLVVLALLRIAFAIATPLLLHVVIDGIGTVVPQGPLPLQLLAAALLLGSAGLAGAVATQHWYYNALTSMSIIVNAMNTRVVHHVLRLRRSARARMQTGDMVNNLSSDTDAVADSAFFLPELFYSLLSVVAVVVMLFAFLGMAAFASVAALLLITPIITAVAKRYRRFDQAIMDVRDHRVTLMSQILHGIRVVKYHAWESSVSREVHSTRAAELRLRTSIVRTDAVSTVIFISTTTVIAFVGFGTFTLLGGTLTAPLVFASIALFAMLEEPFGMISHLLARLQHARVAVQRLQLCLDAPTRSNDQRPRSKPLEPVGLEVRNLSVTYADALAPAVAPCTFSIAPGSSVAIVGPVGAGKSTLLRTLLSIQMPQGGTVQPAGLAADARPRTAWVPQEAFILNATVRENIQFGAEADIALDDVLRDCALEHDVRRMQAGLETEIGERGVNLSGGQKQRVSLARAAWHQPGLVGLDDPLSAVDVDTESHLVNHLLFERWAAITRLVVTHRLAHLSRFDVVIFMHEGHIVAMGSPEHVAANERFRAWSATSSNGEHHTLAAVAQAPLSLTADTSRITDDEDRETGAVRTDMYRRYVRAMTGTHPVLAPLVGLALLATAAGITVLPILQTRWMGLWTDAPGATSALEAVAIYGAIGAAVLVGWLSERLLWLGRSRAAARLIHDRALKGVLGAPLRFFDSTPMGRILNRFARDMGNIDDELAWNFEQSFKSLSQTVGALVLILIVVPYVVLVLLPVLWLYYRLQLDYRRAAREAKRMESIARSPRYAHFKEMVTGLDVIHGFAREAFMVQGFVQILADYQRAFYCSVMLNRWFSIRVPLISGSVGLATSVGVVVLAWYGSISPGMAGVVLTYALSFWMSLNWTVRAFSEVESRMTSVERLESYAELVPERNCVAPCLNEDTPWPTAGSIEVRNLYVRYAEHLPDVLKGVTFSVDGGSTAGIIGRTGSGKSTLFQTLFRCVEPTGGRILIDGVDITSVPLARLRRAMAIIPQDPTLFIGTVRSNVDRFGECSDADVWQALHRVRLEGHVRSLSGGLDAEVVESGANFSQGQRQLLCLARAILTKARIIVLDEATASVDVETDHVIQRTIRTEFAGVTVLVIAHRLETIADADTVVELADGVVQPRLNMPGGS